MIKGITPKEREILRNILKNYPYEFYAYGSRVKGDYTKGSDLDILIKTKIDVSTRELNELDIKLNESIIPYRVNFSVYKELTKDFYKLIEKDLVRI